MPLLNNHGPANLQRLLKGQAIEPGIQRLQVTANIAKLQLLSFSSKRKEKGESGVCFQYTDRPDQFYPAVTALVLP